MEKNQEEVTVEVEVEAEVVAEPKLTFGQEAVSLTFGPEDNLVVNDIKKLFAEVIDNLHNLSEVTESAQTKTLCATAINEAIAAMESAIKAVS